MLVAGVFTVLLCVCSLSTSQLDLKTCGSENSDVTCSFFFQKVDHAFRERNVLYTLRKSFFPTQGAPPHLFDIFMTININSVPNITCNNDEFKFRDNPINTPPSMSEVCSVYTCLTQSMEWEHQWSKTIITYIIEREDLQLIQDTNFVAYSAATFNNFDTSVFSEEGDNLREDKMNNSLSSVEETGAIRFLLSIDFLPCRPDNGVLRSAWEDILPWVRRCVLIKLEPAPHTPIDAIGPDTDNANMLSFAMSLMTDQSNMHALEIVGLCIIYCLRSYVSCSYLPSG